MGSDEIVPNLSGLSQSNNEETKVAKVGNKRGRPRKNPLAVKDETSSKKSKRGPKPKKLYDIEHTNKIGINVTFNDSENKEDESENMSINDNHFHKNHDSPLGPIEKNLKMIDSHNFSFDSMANLGKPDNFGGNHGPFNSRKPSINAAFDKFFTEVPQNQDFMNHDHRSRKISSVLSPFNYAIHPSNMISPSPMRKPSFPNTDFKAKGFTMGQINSHPNQDNEATQKFNNLVANSFRQWNERPMRKQTEEIDFSGNDHPVLNILNNGGGKNNPLEFITNSILSPDYKPRSFSINSTGWMPPHEQLNKARRGWDSDAQQCQKQNDRKEENREDNNNSSKLIKLSILSNKNEYKVPNGSMRKSTMVHNGYNTIKQLSPEAFPRFPAAFKPFKKRSSSLHVSPQMGIPIKSPEENMNKREDKPMMTKEGEVTN
jgi:hypothetical protein